MHGLIREQGSFGRHPTVQVLVRHLYTRSPCGRVVIVADRPPILLSLIRKEWLKLTRKLQIQRSSTLSAPRILELTHLLGHMQNLRFTAHYSPDDFSADVYVVTVEQLLSWAPECRTMYITSGVTTEQLHMVTAWMPKGGLVVMLQLH